MRAQLLPPRCCDGALVLDLPGADPLAGTIFTSPLLQWNSGLCLPDVDPLAWASYGRVVAMAHEYSTILFGSMCMRA